jgi:hypothetical protein
MSERVVDNPANHGWVEVDGKWVWDASGSSAGAGMVISETEPTDKVEGMQWLNPTTGLVLFWDDEKWLQMPTTGAAGKDGKDAVWSEDANGANYTGTVTVNGDLLAAKSDAGTNVVAVGVMSGNLAQGDSSTAVGVMAGRDNQGVSAVAVGNAAGVSNQSDYAVAIGVNSAGTDQGVNAVAVGHEAGYNTQGESGTAVGHQAGKTGQENGATAIGRAAGRENQSGGAVSVGNSAARDNQGEYSIAIGYKAAMTNQGANGIVISSFGSAVDVNSANHIQLRSPTGSLRYNGSDSWEFFGGSVSGISFRQAGVPVIDAKGLISTLSTLRNATKDETTLEGMRDALADAIGGLIENLEHEIATQEISE